jgi:hypothetical protein
MPRVILASTPLLQEHTIESFLTKIKLLNERIENTRVEFTADKCALLVLMLGLAGNTAFDNLWSTMPDLDSAKAIRMLRSEAQRQLDVAEPGSLAYAGVGFRGIKRKAAGDCKTCGRQHTGVCWNTITCSICGK